MRFRRGYLKAFASGRRGKGTEMTAKLAAGFLTCKFCSCLPRVKRSWPVCANRNHLQKEFPVKRLALFGSYAHGKQIPGQSDVDILVEVEPSIGLRFVMLAERLEQLLGERVGSRVSRWAIKPSLWKRIEPELIDA